MDNRFITGAPTRPRAGRGAQSATLDPIVGYSRSQATAWTRTFSAQDRVLVVLIENGGVDLGIPELVDKLLDVLPGSSMLPSGIKQRMVGYLRDKIKGLTDSLLENAELSLNRYNAAKPSLFGDVVVLRDGTASYTDLKTQLLALTRAGKLIDVIILTHGSNDYISVPGGIDGQKIRDLKTANGGPLSIRAVYMMNCVGSSLNQAWLDAGARASSGAIRNNYLPEPTTYFFWQNWKAGQGFETAVTSAYRKTVNLMNDVVRAFIRELPGGGLVANSISLDDLEFVKDSAPIVQGNRAVTISSDELNVAQSLSSGLATTVLPVRLLRALSDAPVAPSVPRRLSAAGLDFIKGWETFRSKLHNDADGNCTVGYGTLIHAGCCDGRPVEEPYADGIGEPQAADLLATRLAQFQQLINERVTMPLGQNQNDALVSFVSDIGGAAFDKSTLLRLLNSGNTSAVPAEMRKWIKVRSQGTVVERPSLVKRRAAEAELFAKPDAAPSKSQSFSSVVGALSTIDYTIPGTMDVLAQPSPNTCWAAVFTMMYSWRNTRSIAIRDALATLGTTYVDMFDRDIGLDSNTARFLYDASGLVALDSFNPTIDGWVTLLRKYGPLYVDVGYNSASAGTHAVIVTGIAGDGTPDKTSMTYIDPIGGKVITMKFRDFLAKFEATSAVEWPYTIVHWPPATSSAASLPIAQSYRYESPGSYGRPMLSRAQNPVAAVIAGIEVADAAQIGLAAAAMVQSQAASAQGSFTLAFDKAERLLTSDARRQMPGAQTPKSKYRRLILHLPQARAGTAHADVIAEWEGNAYGEIGTVMIRRDLATSTEFSKSSANISVTWLHQIPTDGTDPRAWPIVYSYEGTYDPMGNGYWEFHGEFEINAFGGIKWNKHEVFSRSLADWVPNSDPANWVQRGPDAVVAIPAIPQEQVDYLKSHLP